MSEGAELTVGVENAFAHQHPRNELGVSRTRVTVARLEDVVQGLVECALEIIARYSNGACLRISEEKDVSLSDGMRC